MIGAEMKNLTAAVSGSSHSRGFVTSCFDEFDCSALLNKNIIFE